MRPRAYAQRSQKEVPQMQSSLKGTPHFLYSVYKFKRKRNCRGYYSEIRKQKSAKNELL